MDGQTDKWTVQILDAPGDLSGGGIKSLLKTGDVNPVGFVMANNMPNSNFLSISMLTTAFNNTTVLSICFIDALRHSSQYFSH